MELSRSRKRLGRGLRASRRAVVAAVALASAGVWHGDARAQAPDADLEAVAAARSLGVEGVKLADAGRCADAIEKLARAERLHHAPTILGRLGECQVHTGKIVEGSENLARVVREPLPSNAPPAYVKAKARAQAAYDAAKPRIAKLAISVKAPAGVTFAVTLDGQPLSSLVLDSDRPTDPGEHVVEARAEGYLAASSSVTLAEGQHGAMALKLEPDPHATAAPVAVAAAVTEPVALAPKSPPVVSATEAAPHGIEAPAPSASGHPTAAYVAFGVGAAGIGVGIVAGALALSGRSDVESECPNKVCPPSSRDTLDSTRTFGTISTVGVVAGAGIFVVGTILWFTAPATKGSGTGEAQARDDAPVRVSPWVGVGAGGGSVTGRF